MKKIHKILPYKLVIIGLIIILGSVGISVKAANQPTLEDVVNQFLSSLQEIGQTPSIVTEESEQTLGGLVHQVKEYFSAGLCFDSGGQRCIKQVNSVLKYTNDGGTNYIALNTSQSSTQGWNTDPTNTYIYTTTNGSGNQSPVVIGSTASTSIAQAGDVLMVVGSASFTGDITANGGAFIGNAAGASVDFTWDGNTDTDLFIVDASGDKVGISEATPTYTLDVGGDIGGDEYFYHNGDTDTYLQWRPDQLTIDIGGQDFLNMASSSGASVIRFGTTTPGTVDIDYDFIANGTSGNLFILGSSGFVGVGTTSPGWTLSVTDTTQQFGIGYDGTTYCSWTVGSTGDLTQDCTGNDVSFASDNLTTTGNISGANGTFTGSMTWDTSTLIVANTTDRVGVGSTTPFATLSVDSNAGDRAFLVGSSTRNQLLIDANMDLFVNDDDFVVDWSSGYTGLGTTTPFTALAITNTGTQLSLAYDGTNYSTITTGSGGDLTVAASGGDISFSNENLVTTGTLGAATTTISSGDLVVDTNALIVKYLENRVGIGTTTPTYALSITDTGTQIGIAYDGTNYGTLAVGSGGDLTITATGGDISFSNENLATTGTLAAATTTVSTGLIVDTNTLLVDAINNRVGIGSTTPAVTLGIGANMTSTSTIMAGRLCMITAQEDGTVVYLRLGANQPANQPFATSTTPCNQ